MKPRIALLFNVRHHYPDPDDPRTLLETDFDDPETIEFMVRHLRRAGFSVVPIEADENAYHKLKDERRRLSLVFNYAEGIHGADREAQMPAVLEMLQIPYTGSTPLTHALVFNKARTKEVLLANGISTLPFALVHSVDEIRRVRKRLKRYPLIVKPVAQGSSAGINNASVVRNLKELRRQTEFVIGTFKQPALIEPFIAGREFSVPMLGNPPRIMPIVEADHSLLPEGYAPIDSLEVKWFFEEQAETHHLRCPAKLSSALRRKVEKLCQGTWTALGVRDWCRIDIRCDEKNEPYVIEVNTPAGLIPPEVSTTSYFPLSARAAGLPYQDLLREIVGTAAKRYRLLWAGM